MKKIIPVMVSMLIIFMLLFLMEACKSNMKSNDSKIEIKNAVAVMVPGEGSNAKGKITFLQQDGSVKIIVDMEGLKSGKHGFHIHEFGDVSDMKGVSAGGHFNPTNKKHGGPMDAERHVGDLGNIIADKNGKVHQEIIDKIISLNGVNSIIGRAVVVHAGMDDLKTQPTGNSGARVAFGVIGIAKSEETKK